MSVKFIIKLDFLQTAVHTLAAAMNMLSCRKMSVWIIDSFPDDGNFITTTLLKCAPSVVLFSLYVSDNKEPFLLLLVFCA